MLSSINAFGGLSATQLLLLIGAGAPSASASPNAKETSRPQSNTIPGSGGPTDAAAAIKAILVQAQINQAPTGPIAPQSFDSQTLSGNSAVAAAYGEVAGGYENQTFVSTGSSSSNASNASAQANDPSFVPPGQTQSLDYLSVTRAPIGAIITQSAFTEIASSSSVAAGTYNAVLGVYQNETIANTDLLSSDAQSAAAQTNGASLIQFGRSIANSSVNVGFSVDDLGPMVDNDGIYSAVNPQGNFQVELQMDFDAAQGTANEGESCTAGGQSMNISGLTASQAQDILDGFEKITGGSGSSSGTMNAAYTNTENFSGMDVAFSGIVYQ